VLLTVALWGGTSVAVKFAADALPPIAIAAMRFGLAAVAVGLWSRITSRPLGLGRRDWLPTAIVGVLLFVQIGLFNIGLVWSNASHGTVLINVYVFFVIGLEHFVTKMDRLTRPKIVGMLLAAAGVVLTMAAAGVLSNTTAAARVDTPGLAGDLVLLVSALVLSIKVVVTKVAVQTVAPLKIVFWQHVFGAILFVVASLFVEGVDYLRLGSFTPPVVWGLLYQGVVVGGFCFFVHTTLLEKYSATQISVFSVAMPLFGVTFAVLLRGDPLPPMLVAAGVCVALGIYFVTAQRPLQSNDLASDPRIIE
jgi:drug/metabolite transporter (DMT)-like permease